MVRIFKWLAVITLIFAIMAGILSGYLSTETPKYSFESRDFSWLSAINWWVLGVISAIFIFGFARILECLESITSILKKTEVDTTSQSLGNAGTKLSKLSGYTMSSPSRD
ncbi:hypothetical protein ACFOQM_12305 [Paenibacillus sp. GCM10012307]|uniref:Uncharacterized protein n=1 Tax=Paenibacillus roseus TaxID=2798579 RepID=A0A934J5Q9_9BACL|nr:hypothetical protein [Paenibacillus roseus]MBJ6362073.1 hypothetical protein [Paenibacillus roseus]